jgi:hypothetical protein
MMSSGKEHSGPADVERIHTPPPPTTVSDELGKLMGTLREHCSPEAVISFQFDGKLHVHIDVRDMEEIARLESILPSLCGGAFSELQRGLAAHHSFFHRLSARVAR